MGLLCIFMGTQMFQTGHQHFGPNCHAYRKMLFPQLPNKVTADLTFDDISKIVIQAHGVLFALAGVAIMLGNRFLGPLIVIYQMQFLIVMQDNPYLVDYIKPAPKSKAYKWADLTRHISVIGAAVLMMSAEVQVADEKEEKKKK